MPDVDVMLGRRVWEVGKEGGLKMYRKGWGFKRSGLEAVENLVGSGSEGDRKWKIGEWDGRKCDGK